MIGPCRAPLPSSRPKASGPVGVGHHHSPHGATDQPARRAKPSAPRSADRGSKPPPTVPAEAEVRCAPRRDGGVGRRHAHRGGRAPRVPPAPRACCVASPAANRYSASCRHLSSRSHQARLAAGTSDDPARRAATTFRTRSKPPPTVPQQAARWVRTRVRRLRTTAEALDLNRICDLWHAYLGPAAAQGSGPALARRRRPAASREHGEQREHEHQDGQLAPAAGTCRHCPR